MPVTPPSSVPPVILAPTPKASHFFIFFTILFLAVFSIAGYFGYQNLPAVKVDRLIKDCLSRGGALGESYPPQCFTPTPTITTTLTPTPDTTNWKTYTNPTTSISFKYPPEWEYTESKTFNSVTFNTKIKSQEKRGDQFLDFVFEALLEDQRNYNEWVNNPGQTQSLGTEQINNLSFEKFIVADMYYSLNYIYRSPNGKIVRFMIWPYNAQDATKFPASLKNTINQILYTFKFVEQTTLVPPDFQTQVAGVCAPVSKESIIVVTVPIDNVPQPRCVHVTSNQKLKIVNQSQGSININVGKIQASLAPTQSFQFPKTLGEFLASGGHSIVGAEIWLE